MSTINEAHEKAIQGNTVDRIVLDDPLNQPPKVTRDWLMDRLLKSELQNLILRQDIARLHDEIHQQSVSYWNLDQQLVGLRDQFVKQNEEAYGRVDAETALLRERVAELSVGTHIEVYQRNCWGQEPPRKLEVVSWGSSGGKTLIHVA